MSEEEIIRKAKKLGINPNNNPEQSVLDNIAEALGLDVFNYSTKDIENILNSYDVESLDSNYAIPNSNINYHNRFGEREYNRARNENGSYDKNYYKSKGEELDKKVEDAKNNVNNKTKEESPTKTVNKTKSERLNDRLELLKAQKNRFQNKIDGAKAKAYAASHPREILKDQVKSKINSVKKEANKKVKTALVNVIKKNPYILLGLGMTIILFIILALLFSASAINSDSVNKYCNSTDEHNFSLISTPINEEQFTSKVTSYYESLVTKDEETEEIKYPVCYSYFTNTEILKTIYNVSLDNDLSPEFTIINADANTCVSYTNLWNLQCDGETCTFDTLEEGIKSLGTKVGQFDLLIDYLKSIVSEDIALSVYKDYITKRNNIFYDGNYSFNCDAIYNGEYSTSGKIFRQGDPAWASIPLGNSNASMGPHGCAVTSLANGINQYSSYITIEDFDAGDFIRTLNADGSCFVGSGWIVWGCPAISKVAPSVSYVTSMSDIQSLSNSAKYNYINSYPSNKYFIIVGYSNAQTRSHYVLFNGFLDNDTYSSIDPSPGAIVNHSISDIKQIVVYKYN